MWAEKINVKRGEVKSRQEQKVMSARGKMRGVKSERK